MEGRVAVIPIQTGFAETPDLRAYGIYFRVPTIIRIASMVRLPIDPGAECPVPTLIHAPFRAQDSPAARIRVDFFRSDAHSEALIAGIAGIAGRRAGSKGRCHNSHDIENVDDAVAIVVHTADVRAAVGIGVG